MPVPSIVNRLMSKALTMHVVEEKMELRKIK
jgi:hypothetical protein